MENDQDYGQNTFGFLENADLNTASSKMCMIYSETGLEEFCETWPASGMIRLGRSSTPNTQEFPKEGAGFTFWESVTESPMEPTYSSVESVVDLEPMKPRNVSPKSAAGYLRRQSEGGKRLPTLLNNALMNLIPVESPQQSPRGTGKATQT